MGKARTQSSKWSAWQGFGVEPQQSSLRAYVCVLWGERWVHKGWGSQARGIYLYELICFSALLLPSPSPFSCLYLLGDDSHLLCSATTISHQKQAVTLKSPKLFCVRSLHCLHLLFGVQDSNTVMGSMPVTQHRLMKCSHLPVTHWCLDGILGFWVFHPSGSPILELVDESSLHQRNGLYKDPGKAFISWHQVLR